MDDTKREELEKACKKEKNHKVRTRMVAIRMVRVRSMSVEETANILVRCPTWIRNWLRRYDEGGLEGLRALFEIVDHDQIQSIHAFQITKNKVPAWFCLAYNPSHALLYEAQDDMNILIRT